MQKNKKTQYPISTLKNGTRVVAAPLKERRSVAIGIWVGVGGRNEKASLSGVSHFLEHLVFKGTSKRSMREIKESIEGVGGSMNAFTSEEYTCFLAKVARKHFENVFDVLADMVLDASLKEEDIEKERTVILEEIKMTQDQPSQLADEFLTEIVWPRHPLGRPLAGTFETVSAMTRVDIKNYRDHFYQPGFITVAAAGDIDQKLLLKITERRFTGERGSRREKVELFKSSQKKPAMKLFSKATEQTHMALAFHAFSKNHEDEYALDILNVILGGNMSSRLFHQVREERGLAYDVGSFLRRYRETGAFVVSAGVDNKKKIEALRVILEELQKMTQELVTPDELVRAKEFYLGQLDLGLENSMNHMLWIGEDAVTLGKCRTPGQVIQAVQKITREDLKKAAHKVFHEDSLNLAVVGPSLSEKEFKPLLSFA